MATTHLSLMVPTTTKPAPANASKPVVQTTTTHPTNVVSATVHVIAVQTTLIFVRVAWQIQALFSIYLMVHVLAVVWVVTMLMLPKFVRNVLILVWLVILLLVIVLHVLGRIILILLVLGHVLVLWVALLGHLLIIQRFLVPPVVLAAIQSDALQMRQCVQAVALQIIGSISYTIPQMYFLDSVQIHVLMVK